MSLFCRKFIKDQLPLQVFFNEAEDFIQSQCFHVGFLIVGGQEGRLPQGTVSSGHYICVNSGASHGGYGYTLCDGPGQAAVLLLERVHVVSASPRILAASIVARYCRILTLGLHILTFKAKLAARQAVYDDASLILQSCARSARHVCLH